MKRLNFTFLLILGIVFSGCSTIYPNQILLGKTFPSVLGQTLTKEKVSLPSYFKKKPVVLLIGYKQDSQFDIDRWLIGLDIKAVKAQAFELPTIAGMFPRMFKTKIDEGMRRGIPKEIWGSVITIYKDGKMIQEFTGNTRPNNARVMILNKDAKIVYFYDRGFSVSALNELVNTLNKLGN